MKKHILLLSLIGTFYFGQSSKSYSQENDIPSSSSPEENSAETEQLNSELVQDDFFDMSLEDLLNVNIVSASRKEESAFEAPLSSWVVSRKEISAMGATSIPDALRICPGIIVREISNGTYDVSIRGGVDGLMPYGYTFGNTSILVMIDNRPVFSYLQGGTYWQNLPVGMAEIDRIEVVYGPASSLYGPNAVSGVINVITNRPKDVGTYASGVAMYGPKTELISTQVGSKFNEKLSLDVALNYERRTRFTEDFYNSANGGGYTPLDSFPAVADKDLRFPKINQSLEKSAATANLRYDYSKDVNVSVTGSLNRNIGLMSLAANTSLSNYVNESENIYVKSHIHGFNLQASYLTGTQGLAGYSKGTTYDYKNTDLYLDYDFSFLDKKLQIKPAVSYQNTIVDDLKYSVNIGKGGIFNKRDAISDLAGALKIEANPFKKLRVIVAGRYDKFNHPSKGIFSYQGIVNFSENTNNITRFVVSKSSNSSFLGATYLDTKSTIPQPNGSTLILNLSGNKDLILMNNTMIELGHRIRISDRLILDAALFHQQFKDFNVLVTKVPVFTPPATINLPYNTENLPLVVTQKGVTISLQSSFMEGKVQFRPHVTFQETTLKNYSPNYNDPGARGPMFTGSTQNTSTEKSKFTPTVWSGFNLIVIPIEKVSLDLSGYYFSNYVIHSGSESNFSTGVIKDQEGSKIASKFLLNINVRYEIIPKISTFINVQNILNQKTAESFGSDKLGTNFMGGLSFNY